MAHYYDENPTSPSDRRELEGRFHGINFRFTSDSNVFSKKQIDFGTSLLLENALRVMTESGTRTGKVLDLGCGYGVIGVVIKRSFPAMDVTMADINSRAIELSKENAKANGAGFVSVVKSDGWSELDGSFGFILTNPPVRAGKQTVFAFYEGAAVHLEPGGSIFAVLQKKQGAQSSVNKLTELFGNCEILAKDSGYWILRSIRR
jgi:16S rRNA (guanine1207-N2)-methyltransferase